MPTKKPAPLPEPLRYLQPFADALAKLAPEDLNEDVDASRLDAALRRRVRGLDEEAADAELAADRALLERWLKDKPDHPAHWIRGFLLSPDVGTHLARPQEPPPRGPQMFFEAPNGWKVARRVPGRLDLKAGKLLGEITAVDQETLEMMRHQSEEAAKLKYPGGEVTTTFSAVAYGECSGRKMLLRMTRPAAWMEVEYLLAVPGGFVCVSLGTVTGADFDESPLESKLHTLRLSASA